MRSGYIYLHRKILEWPYYKSDSRYAHLWLHLLLKAVWTETRVDAGGKTITLKPGQFISGRNQLENETGIHNQFIKRALLRWESDQQITRHRSNKYSLFTILNWCDHQYADQQHDQQMTSKRPADDQQVTTKEEVKKVNKDNNKSVNIPFRDIILDFNEVMGSNYTNGSQATKRLITARWNEGFRLDDFKIVHRKMFEAWNYDEKMRQFLRPQTLYTGKFESYLNRPTPTKLGSSGMKAARVVQGWLESEDTDAG